MIRAAFFSLLTLAMFVGCAQKEPTKIEQTIIKANSKAKPLPMVEMLADFGIAKSDGVRAVDTIVVHTAYSPEGEAYDPKNLYKTFKKYSVSPHYMIGRDGTIYKMADENDIAYHAGKSRMEDGREGVNAFSIGVELINSVTDYPTRAQYISLANLIEEIKERHKIEHVVGHKDIAPMRKSDPWNFDFDRLAMMLQKDKHARDSAQ